MKNIYNNNIIIKTMVKDVKILLKCRPEDGLHLSSDCTKSELLELLHYVFLSGEIKNRYGESTTYNALVAKVLEILHLGMVKNPNSYINGIEIKLIRNKEKHYGIKDKYSYMIRNGVKSPLKCFITYQDCPQKNFTSKSEIK